MNFTHIEKGLCRFLFLFFVAHVCVRGFFFQYFLRNLFAIYLLFKSIEKIAIKSNRCRLPFFLLSKTNFIHFFVLWLLLPFQLARLWMNTPKVIKVVATLNVNYFFVLLRFEIPYRKSQFKRNKKKWIQS